MRPVLSWSQTPWASATDVPLAPFFRIPCPFKKRSSANDVFC